MKTTGNASASTSKTGGRLTGKDLINVGIFTAIYFVVVFAVACLGFIPILMAAICGIIPLIAGIPYMLFLTRARKFGMITILGLLTGIIMFITGMGYFSIATGLVFGLIADLIWKSGSYASASRAILSHGVFSCWIIGNFLPFLITADTYLRTVRAQYGDASAAGDVSGSARSMFRNGNHRWLHRARHLEETFRARGHRVEMARKDLR